jgi:hypothetical protein
MVETLPKEYNNFLVLDKYSPDYDIKRSYYVDTDPTHFYQVVIRDMYSPWSPKNIRTKIKFAKELLVYRQLSSNLIITYEVVSENTHVGTAIPVVSISLFLQWRYHSSHFSKENLPQICKYIILTQISKFYPGTCIVLDSWDSLSAKKNIFREN